MMCTERLQPVEFERELLREELLERRVDPVDREVLDARALQQVRLRRPVAERVERPAAAHQWPSARPHCRAQNNRTSENLAITS